MSLYEKHADDGLIAPDRPRVRRQSLDALFAPSSIAVIGASADSERIGGRIVSYLKQNFHGALCPINPSRDRIQDLRAWPTVAAIGLRRPRALIVPKPRILQKFETAVDEVTQDREKSSKVRAASGPRYQRRFNMMHGRTLQ